MGSCDTRSRKSIGRYTLVVTRRSGLMLVLSVYAALPRLSQDAGQSGKHDASSAPPEQSQAPGDESLPEDDESERQIEYTYNPLQAEHQLNVGNFYFKKKNYNSALGRYSRPPAGIQAGRRPICGSAKRRRN